MNDILLSNDDYYRQTRLIECGIRDRYLIMT